MCGGGGGMGGGATFSGSKYCCLNSHSAGGLPPFGMCLKIAHTGAVRRSQRGIFLSATTRGKVCHAP